MAAEEITPTDEITGLPHIILPYDLASGAEFSRFDFHHHFFPRRSDELNPEIAAQPHLEPENMTLEDIAGIALRICRGQLLGREIHEEGHKRLLGPILPKTVDEKFVTIAKACSGIVSRFAIDLRIHKESNLVYMDDITFERAANTRVLCSERAYYDRPADYRRKILGGFFLKYGLSQDLHHLSPSLIDEFLTTNQPDRRRELGNFFLREALEIGISPVLPLHQALRKQGLIQPGKPDFRSSIKKTIHPAGLSTYYPQLAAKLAA